MFTITYSVERFIVLRQDRYELLTETLVLESDVHDDEDFEGVELELECECDGESVPAKLSGPPEDCHPDESWFEMSEFIVAAPYERFQDQVVLTSREEYEIEVEASNYEPDFDPPDPYDW